MATKDHILQYFCRICGEIAKGAALTNNERFERLGWKSKKSEDVSYVLQKQYGVILENDKEEVHPSKICSKYKECISSSSYHPNSLYLCTKSELFKSTKT